MGVPVDFHHQPRRLADEIAEIWAQALLTAEFRAVKCTAAQGRPQALLRRGRIAAELAGAVDGAVSDVEA
ncbi:hypothetical protein NX02_27445 [Sphingomonas sanxanigenens DSM 19645 = NX02]|uniref:Uncharacterized protein n=1 Tax=Sphingomonas sanxanigenens DSM 19645 = NX02 TaxID=1123269 RepID=W0AN05_9SPHN|nr:hypothetical protein NX02_27445 [Sphingomonas sanxanigenens DSM 19645 = NX02]